MANNPSRALQAVVLATLTCAAFLLRGHQFLDQVLVDDEWHAVHMVANASVREIVSSFGLADYSIPLTLYYKALANTTGLSELGMRAPMFLASLACIAVFGAWAWRRFGASVAIIFCALMIVSPLLFYYSRIARPYGLSLFFAPLCVWWFHRWWQGGGARFAWGYGVSAVGLTWLHLLNAPFVFAPMVVALARIVGTRSGQDARRWLTLACVCGIGLLIFVAPPFVLSPAALKEKAATDLPTLATWIGAAHQWLGTRDGVLVVVALAFAALGAREARRRAGEFGVYVCVGLGFTLLAIYLLQPAWVFNALTFARYLILFVPVLLLCAAVGVHRVAEIAVAPNVLRALLPAVLIAALFISGPLPKFFGAPQAYTNHGAHHFDVRSSHNLIAQATAQFPDSPLWKMLHRETISQKTIGYFPWSLLSYETDHPLVQARIGQTLLPVNAQGLCAPPLPGHPVPNSNVRLRNFVVLAHENAAPQVDYLVMRKPFTLHFNSRVFDHRYTEFSTCAKALRARYGEPLAEDTALAIYRVSRR